MTVGTKLDSYRTGYRTRPYAIAIVASATLNRARLLFFFVPVARCGATSLRVARRGSAAVFRPTARPTAQQYSITGRKFGQLLYRCVLFSLFFALVSRCFERQDHSFEVVSLLLTSIRRVVQ